MINFKFIGVGAKMDTQFFRNGNKNILLEELEEWRKKFNNEDIYSTYFRYGSENPDEGKVIGNFVMDFDSDQEQNLEKVKEEVLKTTSFFTEILEIPQENIKLYFSGRKGFHTEIPSETLGIEPSEDLPKKYKKIFNHLKRELNLQFADEKIYDRKRLLRCVNSKHKESGLYKISLTITELKQLKSIEIVMLAHTQKDEITINPIYCKTAADYFKSIIEREKIKNNIQFTPVLKELCPSLKEIFENGVGEGYRNYTCWKLATAFKQTGLSIDETTEKLVEWSSRCDPPYNEKEIDSVVESTFKSDYKWGCNDLLINEKCSFKNNRKECPAFKKMEIKIVSEKTDVIQPKIYLPLDINSVIPEGDSFIRRYIEYASPTTDAPIEFHLCGSLIALGTVIRRNVFLPFGTQHIYPNLWIAIFGKSTLTRKSTSVGIARNLLYDVDSNLVFPNDFSPEALVDLLSHHPQGIFIWPEFASTLEIMDRQYMGGAKTILTELYDCPSLYHRILKGETYAVQNPFIAILTASTLNWFNQRIKEGDILGGFLPRFICIPVMRDIKFKAFPQIEDKNLREELLKILKNEISNIQGEVCLSEDIKKQYETWYCPFMENAKSNPNTDSLGPFYGRLATYVFKIAICLQIAKDRQLNISPEIMEKSCKFVDWIAENLDMLISNEIVFSQSAKDRRKILKMIREHSGISRSTLLQNSNLSSKQLNEVIQTLIESECVTAKYEGKKTVYFVA